MILYNPSKRKNPALQFIQILHRFGTRFVIRSDSKVSTDIVRCSRQCFSHRWNRVHGGRWICPDSTVVQISGLRIQVMVPWLALLVLLLLLRFRHDLAAAPTPHFNVVQCPHRSTHRVSSERRDHAFSVPMPTVFLLSALLRAKILVQSATRTCTNSKSNFAI